MQLEVAGEVLGGAPGMCLQLYVETYNITYNKTRFIHLPRLESW